MRTIMAGLAVLGTLALGTMAPASAHPRAVSQPVVQSHPVQQAEWDDCGSGCQEYRGGGRNIIAGRMAAKVRLRLMIINIVTENRGYAHQARCGEGVARSYDSTPHAPV
jgi:hypothetical protein